MSANYIQLTQINVLPNKMDEVVESWHKMFGNDKKNYELYFSYHDDKESILIITNLKDSPELFLEKANKKEEILGKIINSCLISDWRRQILKLEDSVKPLEIDLPASPFLQLRYIEVPICVYEQYLDWRKDTIFHHVKCQKDIDFFLSYHSVMSTEPGVMFLSGFSCAPEEYLSLFKTPKYYQIVKEAGDKYIAGGEKGLYTKLYKRSHC